jgi:hypothetical protein
LYLVNLVLYLELYSDFAQPAQPSLRLALGDFLALIGERASGLSLRDDPLWNLLGELSGRGPGEEPGADFLDAPALAAWVEKMSAELEERAAAALGVRELAVPFLCTRPGRLALSPTRLDAIFCLAEHALSIRMAGLDRNPGWVPAAGRVIEFHYV